LTFLVSVCVLLRFIVSEWAFSLVAFRGASTADEQERLRKEQELNRKEEEIADKRKLREEYNNEHSTAQDNNDEEAEAEALERLIGADRRLADMEDFISDLLEWFCN